MKQNKPRQDKPNTLRPGQPWLKKLEPVLYMAAIFVLLVVQLKPLVIDRKTVEGVDIVGSIGQTRQWVDYEKESGEAALWNPAIFGGMPIYHMSPARTFSADHLVSYIGRILNDVFITLFIGALGLFLLLRYLGVSPFVAFLMALNLVLWPHLKALWLEGHMFKVRALMYTPWVLLTFSYFKDKKTLFSAALFALAFGVLVRTQHYQIIFYTGLMVFALGIWPFILMLVEKQYLAFAKATGLLVAALFLGIMTAAQPMFLANEYLPWSKRGKTTIDLNNPDAANTAPGTGVSMDYAMQWSSHPSELLTWLVPRFYGGMSAEEYNGDRYDHLKGRQVPGYWGHMPFTQSYEYMGVLLLILAMVGLRYGRPRALIWSLSAFGAFLILLSFGEFFPSFYAFFYENLPYFNKFRAPMMSVTVTLFVLLILAGMGLDHLLKAAADPEQKARVRKTLVRILAAFVVITGILWLSGGSEGFVSSLTGHESAFVKAGEDYPPDQLEIIRGIREEFFVKDTFRSLLMVVLAGAALMLLFLRKNMKPAVLAALAFILMIDLIPVQQRARKDFVDVKRLEKQQFPRTSTDEFLLADTEYFRVFPLGKMLNDNRWAYYHETIGGYNPSKMVSMEEIIQNCLYAGWEPQFPINWNVVRMLNVKYLIAEGNLVHPLLMPVHQDQASGWVTFRFMEHQARAYFVQDYVVEADPVRRLQMINDSTFDLRQTAILSVAPSSPVEAPAQSHTEVVSHTPNRIELKASTERQSLLLISETHYPPGWRIYLDGKEVEEIIEANHALQAIVVPPGEHQLELVFAPPSYFRNINYAKASLGIIYLVIAFGLFMHFKPRLLKKSTQV